jgi:hypothetical protein
MNNQFEDQIIKKEAKKSKCGHYLGISISFHYSWVFFLRAEIAIEYIWMDI